MIVMSELSGGNLYTEAGPPDPDEIEIHLFGRGYGEALAIHFGAGEWMAVNLTLTLSGVPWIFEYFRALGIGRNQIRDLIVTHWHTDHIRGAAEILSHAAPDARLILSSGGQSAEFMRMVARCSGSRLDAAKAAAFEMHELFQIIRRRKKKSLPRNMRFVGRDSVLQSCSTTPARLTFLAPSEFDCAAALSYFGSKEASTREQPFPYIGFPENHASIVLLLELGENVIFLGGDRENHSDQERGWTIVLASKASLAPAKQASVFKISHHGSVTGYCAELWPDHLAADCINIVSAYTKLVRPIPNSEMLNRYKRHSPHLYCTSIPRRSRRYHRTIVSGSGPRILYEGKVHEGSIRLRKRRCVAGAPWSVALFGAAVRV